MLIETVCGSDLHTFHGLLGGEDVPYIMGHEGVGIVSEVGKNVKDFQPGDRVIILAGEGFNPPGAVPLELFGEGDRFSTNLGGLQGMSGGKPAVWLRR